MSKINLAILVLILLLVESCDNSKKSNVARVEKDVKEVLYPDMTYPEIGNYSSNNKFFQSYDKALMLSNVRLKQMDIKTSFGTAHVIECGNRSGETLVLLHGMNATSTMWYPNLKELVQKYHIYAIDFLLEPGKSTETKEIEVLSEVMNWYDEIFKELKIEEMSIIGASRGGWLAVNIALEKKYKINKLILLSPAQTFAWMQIGKDLFSNLKYTVTPKREDLRKLLSTLSSNVDNIDQTYIDLFYLSSKEAKVNKAIMDMRPFSEEQMEKLKMPVLVLAGDDDFINPPKSIDRAKDLILNVKIETINNAGHFLSIDQAKIVNEKMIDFLN